MELGTSLMVMRNRNDGTDARRWWDDLPPGVRGRVSTPDAPVAEAAAEPRAIVTTLELARDLFCLGLLFSAVAVGNLLFIFAAMSFVSIR